MLDWLLPCLIALTGTLVSGCGGAPSVPSAKTSTAAAANGRSRGEEERPRGLLEGLGTVPAQRDSWPAAGVGDAIRFEDVHNALGVDFVFDNGASPRKLMLESTSGSAGWLDYDADGWWDLFLPQGGGAFTPVPTERPSNDQFFRNLGGRAFARVSEQAGLRDTEFGHGVAVGDFDNDGFDDVYVTNVGLDILYQNRGDGTFEEVTTQAGIDNPLWGSSAAWADLDLDGNLDLYICNYVDYDPADPIACLSEEGLPGICHPDEVDGAPNKCYRNLGDGMFRDVTSEWGLLGTVKDSKSLGIAVADFNGDRLPDVFVANDTAPNHLFMNQGNARFEEQAVVLGCASSGLGQHQASMGVGFGDYDDNGYPDLYLTHFTTDSNTLYRNLGPTGFTDVTRETGLHQPTLIYLAFGTVMADFDFNGRQDLFVANGHIDDWRKRTGGLWYMPPQMFSFDGRRWHDCSRTAGPYFDRELLGRAVASADFDDDGDIDLAVVHQNDPMALLRNESQPGHWLKLLFIGDQSNRRGIGAEVTVTQADRRLVQQLPGGTSYCASHQPALFFGLGQSAEPCRVAVRWPSGNRQELEDVAVDQALIVCEWKAEGT